jgi:ring-1,2-phenylacetyl-CoA epoxidase subunit PaaD
VVIEAASRIDAAWQRLAGVLDPEVPVLSVLDLGIVRSVEENDDGALEVVLTPTYSGCPAVEVIESAVLDALQPLGAVRVRRQFAPAWTTDWISDEGKRKLREYGIAPPGAAPVHWHPVRPEVSKGPGGASIPQPERLLTCPRCGSTHTERLSAFGATACKALWRCVACREPFEHFKPI